MEAAQESNQLIQTLSTPLVRAKGWMKLTAVLMIVYGVLTALSIVGIVVAWLPIWMGVLLWQAAGAAEQAYAAGSQAALEQALNKLKTYFTIMGVLTLIGLVFAILGVVFGGIGAMIGMSGMEGMNGMEGMQQFQQ